MTLFGTRDTSLPMLKLSKMIEGSSFTKYKMRGENKENVKYKNA